MQSYVYPANVAKQAKQALCRPFDQSLTLSLFNQKTAKFEKALRRILLWPLVARACELGRLEYCWIELWVRCLPKIEICCLIIQLSALYLRLHKNRMSCIDLDCLDLHHILHALILKLGLLKHAWVVKSEHVKGVSQILHRSFIVVIAFILVPIRTRILMTRFEAAWYCWDIDCLVGVMSAPRAVEFDIQRAPI